MLEVLINCAKHFDLSSSLTASCVARWMICWVCRLYFSGLVFLVLSLDECLIKINCGLFCVAPRKLCRLVWHRVWLVYNFKRCFYWTTIFLWKMAEFSMWWFGCSVILRVFNIRSGHLIYIYIYFYEIGKICTDITPTNSRAKWEDFMKASNYIENDFYQEPGWEYSTEIQIIVKADRGKAIPWLSVIC